MTQVLLAYLSGDFSDADVGALRQLGLRLAETLSWTVAPPEFVDHSDAESCSRPEDEPVRTIGIALPVSTPSQRPQTQASEVEAWLGELMRFSLERHMDFEVQLDQTYVGEIRDGEADRLFRDGLLKGW